jgi:hypothetical protein
MGHWNCLNESSKRRDCFTVCRLQQTIMRTTITLSGTTTRRRCSAVYLGHSPLARLGHPMARHCRLTAAAPDGPGPASACPLRSVVRVSRVPQLSFRARYCSIHRRSNDHGALARPTRIRMEYGSVQFRPNASCRARSRRATRSVCIASGTGVIPSTNR